MGRYGETVQGSGDNQGGGHTTGLMVGGPVTLYTDFGLGQGEGVNGFTLHYCNWGTLHGPAVSYVFFSPFMYPGMIRFIFFQS
jgi:hypothetical protein